MPDRPVPMVRLNRFEPSATPEIVLLTSEELPMLVSVLPVPLIDLLVSVSVVLRATSVSVPVGRVNVPLLEIDAMTGSVRVLLVKVCAAVRVTTSTPPTVTAVALNVPPVTVLPVKVRAVGSDSTTEFVPVAVISLAVPDTEVTAPMAVAEIATLAAAVS